MTDYSRNLRRGFSDFFRLPAITTDTSVPAVEAETDPTSPLYKLHDLTADEGYFSGIFPRLVPTSGSALWLGGVAPPGYTLKWNPKYKEVFRGNTDEVSDVTLAGVNPIVEADLVYNGNAVIERFMEPGGASNGSPPLLFIGNQSNTPNLIEGSYALLAISYNYFDPGYARLKVFYRGVFEAADYIDDIEHKTFKLVYRALPGLDSGNVPFQNDRRYMAKWSVALSDASTIIAYR